MGFSKDQVVQEFGYDDDVDFGLREAIEDTIGAEMVDEDWADVADAVVLWWREEDGDLTDMLVDAMTALDDGGMIWLFTPKPGRDGYVEPNDVIEASRTAGLHDTSKVSVGLGWNGTRLLARGRGK